MRISEIKHIIFCLTVFNFSYLALQSQTIEQTTNFADSLFYAKDYESAIQEYKRICFFQNDTNNELSIKIADCYFFKNDFTNSLFFYNEFISNSCDSLRGTEVKFKIINCHIQNSNFQSAIIELFSLNNLTIKQEKLMNFYLGVCYYSFDNFKTSEEYFIKSIDSVNFATKTSVENFFNKLTENKKKNPKISVALSLILPGSGHIYCGEYKSGISAFFLNLTILSVGYTISKQYKPMDALIAVYPYFQRYYLGTAKKAYEISIEKNNEFKSEKFIELMEILEKQ